MYLLDESIFFPLLGSEFNDIKLTNFSPASLHSKFGKPFHLKNIDRDIEKNNEKFILSTILKGKGRFQYFISDSLSYLGKFMIFDLANLDESVRAYKNYSNSEMYKSKVFFDGTDLIFIDTKLQEAFAIDHDYNFMEFKRK
ncbi:hypothetical protein ACJJIF_18260 [Microbulbifer sp. SSSA002]|uniref:hypothetical protein n=1 Tax=Microbulbifer sp. SSSA002 TaxID=3243376 RepID=UPI004039C05F